MQEHKAFLRDSLAEMGLDAELAVPLLLFADELLRWNQRINLTAITDLRQVLIQHVLDSLSVLPYVNAGRLMDVGSGGGLPGVLIALARPDVEVLSLESRHKKIAFQRHIARVLGLTNFQAEASRVEAWRAEQPYAQIISRAFASLADFIGLAGMHLAPDGRMLAMKGKAEEDERNAVPTPWQVVKMPRLTVPSLSADRHLVILARGGAAHSSPHGLEKQEA